MTMVSGAKELIDDKTINHYKEGDNLIVEL